MEESSSLAKELVEKVASIIVDSFHDTQEMPQSEWVRLECDPSITESTARLQILEQPFLHPDRLSICDKGMAILKRLTIRGKSSDTPKLKNLYVLSKEFLKIFKEYDESCSCLIQEFEARVWISLQAIFKDSDKEYFVTLQLIVKK